MPRRCCRQRCARTFPHVYTPLPRPCVDSLQVPVDFFLRQGVIFTPPCYHLPITQDLTCGCHKECAKREVICGCPKTSSIEEVTCECKKKPSKSDVICGCPKNQDSGHNPNCMAANNGSSCSGQCKPTDNKKQPRGQGQPQEQAPCMPTMNHYVEPPDYDNQFSYTNRPRYGPNDRHPFTSMPCQQTPQTSRTDLHKTRVNNPPPPRYDTVDPPDYGYGPGGGCCQNSENYTEIQTVTPERQCCEISPPNTRSPSPYARSGSLDERRAPARYEDTPKPRRRPESNKNLRSSFNAPSDQGYFSASPAKPPLQLSHQVAAKFDAEPSPCCANALGQKKREGPPLPQKGMSGAHRPGYLVEDQNEDNLHQMSQCMSANNSSCVHGITSIMPNYSSNIIPEKKPSAKGVTCTCKDAMGRTVKPVKKNNCRRQEGTEVCESVTCLANKNRLCPCTYPPAFKQYSCTGNITGTCNCTQPFP